MCKMLSWFSKCLLISYIGCVWAESDDARLDEKVKYEHRVDNLNILLYTLLLCLTVLTIWMFKHRRLQWLHETGLAILYGLVVGAILRYGSQHRAITHLSVAYQWPPNDTLPPDTLWLNMYENSTTLLEDRNRTYLYQYKGAVRRTTDINEIDMKATFDPEIFFNILLPPIIFNAGFNMKRKYFFRNLGAIMSLAFLGSTIATFVTGSVVYSFVLLVSPFYNIFSFADCLSFGALISATDPVTVLAIFNDLQVDVNLYALVFGESVLNDAVAIVLTGAIANYASLYHSGGDSAFEFAAFVKSIGSFVSLFTLSFLIGSLMGCLTAILTKFTRLHDYPLLESSLFFLMSYSTFLMAETAELTGIVAVLFCGICQAHYTYNNLSADSQVRTKQIFELLNFMAENFIFCYIGVSMFTFPLHRWNLGFIIISFLAIAIGRAANIYPLCFLLNCGRKYKIPAKFQHMLFFSGLRGAMAFALAIRNTVSESKQIMLTTTSVIVIVTVIFNGGLTNSVLHWLDIKCGQDDPEQRAFANLRDRSATSYQSVGGSTAVGRKDSPWTPGSASAVAEGAADPPPNAPTKSVMARQWGHIDTLFLKPLLTHARPTLLDTMPVCCQPIARFFTTTRQLTQLHEIGKESVSTQLSHGTPGPSTVTTGAAPSPSSLPINAVSRPPGEGLDSLLAENHLIAGTPTDDLPLSTYPSPSSSQDAKPLQP